MILPSKHLGLDRSLIGTGSVVLGFLSEPRNVSTLWYKAKENPGIKTFESFSLTLDFLFAIGAITFNNGYIEKRKK
jgi:hypothetical protein